MKQLKPIEATEYFSPEKDVTDNIVGGLQVVVDSKGTDAEEYLIDTYGLIRSPVGRWRVLLVREPEPLVP